MLFTSYSFIAFLLIMVAVYYIVPKKVQWPVLLVGSYIFYYIAGVEYLPYIITTTVTTYFIAKRISRLKEKQAAYLKQHKAELSREDKKLYKSKEKSRQFRWLLLCLFTNIGILAVVKYTDFVITNMNGVIEAVGSENTLNLVNFILPLGISFYTFQTMGYVIDVYRGKHECERNLFKLALFVSFFPQLIQGPISRFDELATSLFEKHAFDIHKISLGAQRVLWGYFKKMVIADRILVGVTTLIGDTQMYHGAYVFVGMLFYALNLYADFTGGIDITIGIAQMLGIKVAENFNRPYFSKGIKEYWKRWHITMGTWFTDYIFYPISVCGPMLKFSKFSRKHFGEAIGKRMPVYVASFAVWFTTGIWHGSSWNFIVWGIANFVVIMISQEFEPMYDKFHKKFPGVAGKFYFRLFQVIRTVLLMSCIRMFDCYRDVPLTFKMFGTMFTSFNWNVLWNGSLLQIGLTGVDYGILAIGLGLLITVSLVQRGGSVREKIGQNHWWVKTIIWYGLFLAIILFGAYGIGYDQSQFIYNQF